MTSYNLLVFLHVLGAVGIFAAWGMETVVLGQLRHAATVDQARSWTALRGRWRRTGPIAMLTTLATGLWMMRFGWGHQPWIATAFVGLILIVFIGVTFERGAAPGLAAALGDRPERLQSSLRDTHGWLATSLTLRIAIGIAILGLMTAKPDALGSLVILAAAIVLGVGMTLGFARRGLEPPATASASRGAGSGGLIIQRYLHVPDPPP
jgi:hypothetical protein